ncbi:hypothetical protein GCM10023310_70170 [Paenibacillus vulneris]|uniref:Helix-turn-helix domain-containing protein n=1 Tax=Paenibacillus vulneris TaxID=1133364 RepID=A0ABW3UI65_9BACL
MSIGKRLRLLRESKGLSQGDFAKILNIARTTYSGYETETREPDICSIIKFADFYSVSIDYLFGREIKREQNVVTNKNEIALRLKKSRELKGFSQIEVSKLTGISNKTISGYENGISEPDLITISKLSYLYGVSIDWIVNGVQYKNEVNSIDLEEQLRNCKAILHKFKELADQIN